MTERKGFLSSFTLTLSALLNRYKRVNQILKVVILNNIKNTSQLAFVIISNDLIRKLNVGYVKKSSKMMIRSEIIVILLVDIEELHTTNVILTIENLILRLWCFITLVGMIVTYL